MTVTDKHKTVVWRGGTAAVLAILGFLGAYVFNEVTAIPEVYSTKTECFASEKRIFKRIERDNSVNRDQYQLMQEAVRRDLDQVIKNQMRIQDSIEKINQYLLQNHSN